MKLIKLSEEHYVVVDDSKYIVDCDWVLFNNEALQTDYFDSHFNKWEFKNKSVSPVEYQRYDKPKKITHSTQPIERWFQNIDFSIRKGFGKIQQLSLLEVKELLGEVYVEKKMISPYPMNTQNDVDWCNGHQRGYNLALEDNKERKYTEEDMIEWAMCMIAQYVHGNTNIWNKDLLRESLPKPKTEWDVEFVDGKLKLK